MQFLFLLADYLEPDMSVDVLNWSWLTSWGIANLTSETVIWKVNLERRWGRSFKCQCKYYRITGKFRWGRTRSPTSCWSRSNFCVAQGFFFFFCSWLLKVSRDGGWALSQDCSTHCKVVFFLSQLEFPLLQLVSVVSCHFTVLFLGKVWLYHLRFGSGKL